MFCRNCLRKFPNPARFPFLGSAELIHSSSQRTHPGFTNDEIKEITVKWVKKWVFGLNLCPWSGKVLADHKLKVVVNQSKNFEDISKMVLQETKILLQQPNSNDKKDSSNAD